MKKVVVSLMTLFGVVAAVAQQDADALSRRIEVTRDYVPTTEKAEKFNISPRMSDTILLHPQIDYSITPTAWMSVYNPEPIAAVGVTTAKWEHPNKLYARLGVGMPFNTLADIYYTPFSQGNTTFGAYLNHKGLEAKIKNDYGDKRSALTLDSRLGAFTQTRFDRGGGMRLGAEYRAREYAPYGGNSFTGADMVYGGKLLYDDLKANVSIGSDFGDLSKFNVRFGISGGYFGGRTKGTDGKYAQLDLNANIDAGFAVAGNPLLLGFVLKSSNGVDLLSDRSRNSYELSAVYSLSRAKRLDFDLGLKYVNSKSNYIIPVLKFNYDIGKNVKGYVDVDGSVNDNSYRALSLINPYVVSGLWGDKYNSHVDIRTGVNVNTSAVDFDFNVGYDMHDNYNIFINADKSSRFYMFGESLKVLYMSLRSDITLSNDFSLAIEGRYNSPTVENAHDYNLQNLFDGTGIPEYKAAANVGYRNGRISFNIGVELLGERSFASVTDLTYSGSIVSMDGLTFIKNTVDGTLNLTMEGRYELRKGMELFVRGDNMLSQKMYIYNYYPSLGANVMAGVSVNF